MARVNGPGQARTSRALITCALILGALYVATGEIYARPKPDFKSLEAVITDVLEVGQRRNSRQRIFKEAYAPYFLDQEEVGKYMVVLNRRALERRWLRDRYFYWKIVSLEEDASYGYGAAEIELWGISRFWLPRSNTIRLSATYANDRWWLKGPPLENIDIRE